MSVFINVTQTAAILEEAGVKLRQFSPVSYPPCLGIYASS